MRKSIMLVGAMLPSLILGACATSRSAENEDPETCKAVKPGVLTTVNYYCVVVNDDPVDPEVVREYKGQRVGFCCPGCIKRWNAMTDEQKDAAVKNAVAKGRPQG
jgi:hypothetical protein